MTTVRGIRNLTDFGRPTALTIGNFDGLHLGHRKIISLLNQQAELLGIPSVVMTFDPHPRQILSPDKPTKRLFEPRDLEIQLEKQGVDFLVIEPFSVELSKMSAADFFRDCVWRPFAPKVMVEGYDFSFGANRAGTTAVLRDLMAAVGGRLEIVEAQILNGGVVSSSGIRALLLAGDLELANQMLGRRFAIEGTVSSGEGRGRLIGFPTANLLPSSEFVPKPGVYAGFAEFRGQRFLAVQNIGINPTFHSESGLLNKLEVHLLDFTGDIYGETLRFEFVEYLRAEQKFAGVEELKSQIAKDVLRARHILERQGT